MQLTFWGVRGSIPCPGPDFVRYGGHTACVQVRCGDEVIVFDAGTGMKPLGDALAKEAGTTDIKILLSHTHFDHISGLPFFKPAYRKTNTLTVYSGHLYPEPLEPVLHQIMGAPFFPISPKSFGCDMRFVDFAPGTDLALSEGVTVKTCLLNHPDKAIAYRLEYQGKSVCYVTDTEHLSDTPEADLVEFLQGADAMIYDATYTDETYAKFKGWGHSTWQAGLRLCQAANVGHYYVFHHNPDHDDAQMDVIKQQVAATGFPATVAYEGLSISL